MTVVACVLKSGGEYEMMHVQRLAGQVKMNSPAGTVFTCLTDVERIDAVRTVPLRHGWPDWWAKMELFTLPGPALYLDLDVTITGDLAPLLEAAREHEFVMCQDFERPRDVNSSVMAWRGDMRRLHAAFVAAGPDRVMQTYRRPGKWGDQDFIRDNRPERPTLWQSLLPGQVMSHKLDVQRGEPADDARVIVYHGQLKPWQLERAA